VKQMGRLGQLGAVMAMGTGLLYCAPQPQSPLAKTKQPELVYQIFERPDSTIYTLTIPNHRRYVIKPFVAQTALTVEQVAEQTKATAVINAGFFDPVNQKSTSTILMDGVKVASPQDNERLMQNPSLAPYLKAILNRSELRIYQCGTQVSYAIALHENSLPNHCQLKQAMGGGPQLLPVETSLKEGFTDYVNGTLSRDAIGSVKPNARTAIGLKPDGNVVWVMVAQKQMDRGGMTLAGLADFMKNLGVQSALNLDGGTSSSFSYQGKTIYGKRNETDQPIKRAVKSALVLTQLN
jgi:Phosphodiester glycosidase